MDECFNVESEGSSEEMVKEADGEDREEESKTHQQYSNDKHAEKEEEKAWSSSTNAKDTGHEGECLKCNSHLLRFCDTRSLLPWNTNKELNNYNKIN